MGLRAPLLKTTDEFRVLVKVNEADTVLVSSRVEVRAAELL